ncbi:MAG: STM4011 family radical SAM protein [Pirellulales bacterium]|nr:STM4011 family radical SAM protein [Pirellulales bacterium]
MSVCHILYRGSLTSCNYGCDYCPFAKTTNSRDERRQDAQELDRFADWVENTNQRLGILFTPWGESLVHAHYRQALVRLSHIPHVHRVAAQTNLSCRLGDLSSVRCESLALWATFHPTQVSLHRFLRQCQTLQDLGIRFSVGVVGLREHFDAIGQLRARLSPDVYLWINAYKREPVYYSEAELHFLRGIDPYFDLNRIDYASQAKPCRAGDSAFSVDGRGDVRRCHFVDKRIGNIYRHDIFARLTRQACPNATCGCHIGYVHRPDLNLDKLFGEGFLERIPVDWPSVDSDFTINRDPHPPVPHPASVGFRK